MLLVPKDLADRIEAVRVEHGLRSTAEAIAFVLADRAELTAAATDVARAFPVIASSTPRCHIAMQHMRRTLRLPEAMPV